MELAISIRYLTSIMDKKIFLFLGILFLIYGFGSGALGQPVPRLIQGEPYVKERQKLIDSGWQKVSKHDRSSELCKFVNASRICYLYPEYEESSADGYCSFVWKNIDGKELQIGSYPCGTDSPGNVTGWQWFVR